jgi:type I restriction enzyme S subunit
MSNGKKIPNGWTNAILEDLLLYIQPTNFIVETTEYDDKYKTPVLTAGKTFVLGNTNETSGIFYDLPVIIFDDFTTATKFVNFPFKVKSSAMKILKPTCELVNIWYTYYFIQTIRITVDTHKRYWISNYSQLPITLPPLSEQHRIVAKIEELFNSLDKGIESLKAAQQQLKVYRQAVLKWAFEGKLTEVWREQNRSFLSAESLLTKIKSKKIEYCKKNKLRNKNISVLSDEELAKLPELPKDWKWVHIDALIENEKHSIKAGPFGSSLKKEFYVEEGYKIYGQEQVIAGDANYGDYYVDEVKYNELISCRVKPFDILISLVGTIGKVLILPRNFQKGLINPRLVKISINKKFYNPLFFKYYFESSFLKAIYKQNAHGATMDVLNLGIIEVLPFLLCSVQEQEQIIQEIESRLSVCDKIEESITNSLQQAEALRQSILKKAFEGKLVPQDPNDEPAGVLLQRIKAERETQIKNKEAAKKIRGSKKIKAHTNG